MKNLILIRHGKSSWEYDVGDIDRPLKQRGISDAHLVSEALKKRNIAIDFVYSSPANRAFSTCKIFTNILKIPSEKVEIIEKLYDFGGQDVIDFVKNCDDNYKTVMIFGHNHAFTSISNIFGDKFIDNLPTSGLVCLELDINSWSELKPGTTKLSIFPKELKE